MHELAIAEGIIDIVSSSQREQGFERVMEIRLRVGEHSGIVPECLREFFPYAARGSAAEQAELIVEPIKGEFKCLDCGYEGAVDRREARCPRCESTALKMTRGREFYVDSIKVE